VIDKASLGNANARKLTSKALSLVQAAKRTLCTRKIAVLAAPGVSALEVASARAHLGGRGATIEVISLALGPIVSLEGEQIPVDKSLLTTASVLYDSVYVPGGKDSAATLLQVPEVLSFVQLAYRHFKPIGASNEGILVLEAALTPGATKGSKSTISEPGVVTAKGKDLGPFHEEFASAMKDHRHFNRGIFDKGAEKAPRHPTTKGTK
jgi:catalase